MNSNIIQKIKDIVGKNGVTTSLIDLIVNSVDAGEYRNRPDAVVYPTSTEQVSAIMKLASEEAIPVTPRGAGTNTSGEAVPTQGGIVLDLSRMDSILEINLEDRLVVVQPGVVYGTLNSKLAPMGFSFPPDPGSGKVATLGGMVATNAGGLKGAKYGVTKDYVMGLEVVLPSGEVMRIGTRTHKTSSGFNLPQLFVGSEGALGIVTEAILKVSPMPTQRKTAVASFDKLVDAGNAVSGIMRSNSIPSVLELLDKNLIWALNQNSDLGLPDVEAILLCETDGYTEQEAEFQMKKIVEIFNENGAAHVHLAKDREEGESLWAARRNAYPVMTRLNSGTSSEDTTVPLSKVTALLEFCEELGKKYGLLVPVLGHVGDGNLHPHFIFDLNDTEEIARVKKAKADLYAKTVELNGTLSGEHGIGLAKAPFMKLEHDPVALQTMRNLKKMFDPKGILNPGKQDLD